LPGPHIDKPDRRASVQVRHRSSAVRDSEHFASRCAVGVENVPSPRRSRRAHRSGRPTAAASSGKDHRRREREPAHGAPNPEVMSE
jgi:hypothetical protein